MNTEEELPDFGVIHESEAGVDLECPALVPGLTLQDLLKIYSDAEILSPRNSLAGNPWEWPEVQGVTAVARASALAVLKWKKENQQQS